MWEMCINGKIKRAWPIACGIDGCVLNNKANTTDIYDKNNKKIKID